MSNFFGKAVHPETGKECDVEYLDGHFGGRRFGVRFPDDKIFTESQVIAAHCQERTGNQENKASSSQL